MQAQDERQYYLDQIAERDIEIDQLRAQIDEQQRLVRSARETSDWLEALLQKEWQQHANTAWVEARYQEAVSTVWDALDKLQAEVSSAALRKDN